MLNCKYSEKVWKYLSQSELWIYYLIFPFSGFWNFEIFLPGSTIFGLDLGCFQNFSGISQPGICTLKLWNFFTQVLLELNFEHFLNFFNLVWLKLDFENFLNFFKLSLIVIELWIFLNMYTHMIELVYNCWTLLILTNPTVLYLVDIPPSNV